MQNRKLLRRMSRYFLYCFFRESALCAFCNQIYWKLDEKSKCKCPGAKAKTSHYLSGGSFQSSFSSFLMGGIDNAPIGMMDSQDGREEDSDGPVYFKNDEDCFFNVAGECTIANVHVPARELLSLEKALPGEFRRSPYLHELWQKINHLYDLSDTPPSLFAPISRELPKLKKEPETLEDQMTWRQRMALTIQENRVKQGEEAFIEYDETHSGRAKPLKASIFDALMFKRPDSFIEDCERMADYVSSQEFA